jgi:hypothetical protein
VTPKQLVARPVVAAAKLMKGALGFPISVSKTRVFHHDEEDVVETMIEVMVVTADGQTERRGGNDEGDNYRGQNGETCGARDHSTAMSKVHSDPPQSKL